MSFTRPEELADTDKESIREVFEVFDADRDGRLDFHELKCAMKALGFEPANREILEIVKRHDPASQRYISFPEFEREMATRISQRDPMEEVRRAFALFSPDGRGITFDSLRTVARDLGEAISDDELRAMITEFDLDEDGRISLDEFTRICTR